MKCWIDVWFMRGQAGGEDLKAKLEKIKKQLSASSGSVLLQGPLLKRSETVSLSLFLFYMYIFFPS